MSVACPNCGSRFLRDAQPRSLVERLRKIWFVTPVRCLDCQTRFVASTVKVSDWKFARCPLCYRMDLNGWTGKKYIPPFWMSLKIALGAKRFRCEYCRFNFASFGRRKEAFTFKRWEKMNAGQARAAALAERARKRGGSGESLAANLAAPLPQQETDASSDRPS